MSNFKCRLCENYFCGTPRALSAHKRWCENRSGDDNEKIISSKNGDVVVGPPAMQEAALRRTTFDDDSEMK